MQYNYVVVLTTIAKKKQTRNNMNYEIAKMAKALRFLFVVGLPVTTPTAVGGGMGIKTKSKMQCRAINFVIQTCK